ncbi:hypothetical protein DET49_104147 [Salegentibacter sp. 24]|nr:hypothetical protein DET49_104147 [Salegentibacter sp. 24]
MHWIVLSILIDIQKKAFSIFYGYLIKELPGLLTDLLIHSILDKLTFVDDTLYSFYHQFF